MWQLRQSLGTPVKPPPEWHALQSRGACAPVKGKAAWLKPPPLHVVGMWHSSQLWVQPWTWWSGALEPGALVAASAAPWHVAHSTLVPEKLPTALPAWHCQQPTAAWAPINGKRVPACLAISSTGCHVRGS